MKLLNDEKDLKKNIFSKRIFVLFLALILIGCTTQSFKPGINELEKINEKYGVDFKTMPADIEKAVMLRNDMKKINTNIYPESFKLFYDYRIKTIEANIVHLKAWEHGGRASTRDGFGCKALQIIINSSKLRNISAHKGYDSLEVLRQFIEEYPKEAESINMTQRDVVFANYYYDTVEKEARRDKNLIKHFCENKTQG